jgi:hypothetical protein
MIPLYTYLYFKIVQSSKFYHIYFKKILILLKINFTIIKNNVNWIYIG